MFVEKKVTWKAANKIFSDIPCLFCQFTMGSFNSAEKERKFQETMSELDACTLHL